MEETGSQSVSAGNGMTIVTARGAIYTLAGVFWLQGFGGGVPCRFPEKSGHRLFQALPYCESAVLWNLYYLAGVLTRCRKELQRQGAGAARTSVPGAAH
jgi:hypothetical protein